MSNILLNIINYFYSLILIRTTVRPAVRTSNNAQVIPITSAPVREPLIVPDPPKESVLAKRYITREEIVGKYPESDITQQMHTNISKLLDALNKFRLAYGKPMIVNSGLRTPEHNQKVGGSPKSSHMTGEACDFRDPDGAIDAYCLQNLALLEECGLYLEHPDHTKGWCHLQIRRPNSGNRVFRP